MAPKRIKPTQNKKNRNWIMKISILTFCLSIIMGLLSEQVLMRVGVLPAIVVLLMIIFIGVLFDTVGIAVTAANTIPFHSMSAQNIEQGRYCVYLVDNAGPVAAFCNDVIGDISGIISGAATAIIMSRMASMGFSKLEFTIMSAILTGIVAALTVGGKAYGKKMALVKWKLIVGKVGYILCFVNRYLKLSFIDK